MSVDTHELRELLLQSDQEFREIAMKHHELDNRLHELSARPLPLRYQNSSKKSS